MNISIWEKVHKVGQNDKCDITGGGNKGHSQEHSPTNKSSPKE